MADKLYKLALWYIGKCNAKWNKPTKEVKSLNRLTYMMFGKYVLLYGADAEWQKFSRYEVLDNAIQKLARYENGEQEIREKAVDDFFEELQKYEDDDMWLRLKMSSIYEIAEKMKGEK